MMPRKYTQLRNYSKIMKARKSANELKQTNNQKEQTNPPQKIEEQPNVENQEQQSINESDFEDEFEDQFEDQWIDEDDQEEDQDDGEDMMEESHTKQTKKEKNQQMEQKQKEKQKVQVFVGTNKSLQPGQTLQFDNNAYDMLHRLNIEWPSLSIDYICRNSPFDNVKLPFLEMNNYPYEVYTVQGSSNNTNKNSIYLTKWRKLHKTKYDDDPEGQEEEQKQNDEQPQVVVQQIETTFSINRIRSLINSPIVAYWNEKGQIHIADLTKNYEKLTNNIKSIKKEKVHEIVMQSECEGFAINWNPHKIGQLATGNGLGQVQIFQNDQSYSTWKKAAHYAYHKGSVQDIVHSPTQPSVFASCSSDKTLQIVDMRTQSFNKSQLLINAHDSDVNVCDWNKIATNLIVTASDDCSVKVWDLKHTKQPMLCFNWHNQPITSIMFQPNESSVIAVASEDNSVSIWDMSAENEEQAPEIPNELMFIHQGQQEIKQIRFHPIYYDMIISSALDGINIFKPSFELPPEEVQDFKEDLKKPPIREQDLDKYLSRMSLN